MSVRLIGFLIIVLVGLTGCSSIPDIQNRPTPPLSQEAVARFAAQLKLSLPLVVDTSLDEVGTNQIEKFIILVLEDWLPKSDRTDKSPASDPEHTLAVYAKDYSVAVNPTDKSIDIYIPQGSEYWATNYNWGDVKSKLSTLVASGISINIQVEWPPYFGVTAVLRDQLKREFITKDRQLDIDRIRQAIITTVSNIPRITIDPKTLDQTPKGTLSFRTHWMSLPSPDPAYVYRQRLSLNFFVEGADPKMGFQQKFMVMTKEEVELRPKVDNVWRTATTEHLLEKEVDEAIKHRLIRESQQ